MIDKRGFTLIELIGIVLILGVLAALAIQKFQTIATDARASAIKGLEGSIKSAGGIINAMTVLRGNGAASAIAGITFITVNGVQIRLWNGYPDRWWDGIGMTQVGAQAIAGGGYLSSAAVGYGRFTFYGFGNASIPGGNAGWRIETAPNPINCSVSYIYGGAGIPTTSSITTGC